MGGDEPLDPDGDFMVHVFHMNNEMAGYCSVLHAMTLVGSTGHYGRPLKAVVIGFGNTARGAITALHALGVHDVTVLTMRDVTAVASPDPVRRDRAPGPHRGGPLPDRGAHTARPDAGGRSSSPSTTSSSTASCRTPTPR